MWGDSGFDSAFLVAERFFFDNFLGASLAAWRRLRVGC
jgi:hypothetical protein